MRDRLIELIKDIAEDMVANCGDECDKCTHGDCVGKLADHLLAEGVIVPPCKVGDTVYYIHEWGGRVYEDEVTSYDYVSSTNSFGIHYDGGYGIFGRYVFLTREEAEKALERSENGKS